MSRTTALVSVLLLIAACGGATSDGTTVPSDVVTTAGVDVTSPPDEITVPDDQGAVSLEDMPAECVQAFTEFLQAIEPIVQGVDFGSSTADDLEALFTEIEPISDAFEAETADCPELNMTDEESVAAMQQLAERDAPGTAAYFAWIAEAMASLEGGGDVSGDCETDLATLQGFVDQGGTMSDLTMDELTAVGNLMAAAGAECTPERFNEWLTQDSVAAWGG